MTDEVKNVLLALSDRPIAFQKSYAKITKSITSGLLLSQIMYWCSTTKKDTFYKTNEEFAEETGMTVEELKSAKKRLQDLGFISVSLQGVPARSVYTVDLERIVLALHQLVGGKATNLLGEIPPTIYTETTTENIQAIKKEKEKEKERILPIEQEVNYLKILPPQDVKVFQQLFSLTYEKVLYEADRAYDWVHSTGKIHQYKNWRMFFRNWLRRENQWISEKKAPTVAPTTVTPLERNYFQDKDFHETLYGTYEMHRGTLERESQLSVEVRANPNSSINYYKRWAKEVQKESPRVFADLERRYKEAHES